jgi:RecJ-like exonuclease
MSQATIDNVNPATLADISTIVIDHTLPHEEKILSFIQQVGNPYCFMSGDIPVRVCFTGTGKSLSQSLINYFSLLKQR